MFPPPWQALTSEHPVQPQLWVGVDGDHRLLAFLPHCKVAMAGVDLHQEDSHTSHTHFTTLHTNLHSIPHSHTITHSQRWLRCPLH